MNMLSAVIQLARCDTQPLQSYNPASVLTHPGLGLGYVPVPPVCGSPSTSIFCIDLAWGLHLEAETKPSTSDHCSLSAARACCNRHGVLGHPGPGSSCCFWSLQ